MQIRRIIAAGAAVTLAATGLVACGSGDDSDTIRVGTTDAAKKAWSAFEDAAKEKGYKVEIVPFSDYTTPNQALEQGKLDTNNFQHLQYLAEYNKGNDTDLVPIVSTEIVPLALFWKDHDSIDGIDGESVAIPNDPSNQGRAINVLVQAGLVTLRDGAPKLTPTPADIDKDASKVKVVAVDASQTPNAYNEGRPAVINNNWLARAGIDPASSVAADDPNSELAEPYINVFTVSGDDLDNETYEKIVDVWQSEEVTAALNEDSNGTAVQVQRSKEELNEVLDRLVEEYK